MFMLIWKKISNKKDVLVNTERSVKENIKNFKN